MKKWMAFIPALLLASAAVPASGTDLPVDLQTAQGVQYYNGGVGSGERSQMPQIFPLKIVLATDRGLYLNDAEVRILDASGREVLRVQADNGPWLVADVPPGTYTVKATLEGHTVSTGTLRISKGTRRVAILNWRTADVDMGL
jgi:hypothetical protein